MYVGNHRGHPAHVEVLLQRAFFAFHQLVDVALHRFFPVALVGHVDGKFLGRSRNRNVFVGQHEAAHFTVQGEALDAVAQGQHQHGLWAVDRIAGSNLLGAWLQEGLFVQGFVLAQVFVGATQYREDGADRCVDVDVGRTVQWVEYQQVCAFRVFAWDLVGIVHFFGRHAGQVAAPFVGFEQDFVGQNVQFLLHFALHVFSAHAAQDTAQCAFGNGVADFLASTRHHFDKEAQIGRRVVAAGLLDQIATQGNAGHGRLRRMGG